VWCRGVLLVLSSMKGRQDITRPWLGYCLAELLVTMVLMGICLLMAAVSVCHGLERQQARGTAQVAQAAVARAQVSAVWRNGDARVSLVGGHVLIGCGQGGGTEDLGLLAPSAVISANVGRWEIAGGVLCHFLAPFGSPDSGGSIRIDSSGASYKVTVRPESGLTVRSWSAR
jgi:type II secretory pathway pseudopilin PulG